MAILIDWSDEARKTFEEHIAYLSEHWSDKEIKNFVARSNHIISRIESYPEMYSRSLKTPKVRKAPINRYISLYYRFHPSIKKVVLLTFWHSKQNPEKLKY